LESVSIVNNGSKVTEKWMSEYAYYLDIMAVSCDSFDGETNKRIGRFAKVSRPQVGWYRKIASSNTSRLEAHVDFSRLLMKGIFGPYL
jgi:hypothetical protein